MGEIMKIILIILLFILPINAFAAAKSGTITGYFAYESGGKKLLFFKLSSSIVEGCNTSARFVFDETKLNYDAMVATVISAYHSKETVKTGYSASCNMYGNSYDTSHVCIGAISC